MRSSTILRRLRLPSLRWLSTGITSVALLVGFTPHASAAVQYHMLESIHYIPDCMTAPTAVSGTHLYTENCETFTPAQNFKWDVEQGGTPGSNTYQFFLEADNRLLCLADPASKQVKTQMIITNCNNDTDQQWFWVSEQINGTWQYEWVNLYSNMCLDILGGVHGPGVKIVQYTCNDNFTDDAQLWIEVPVSP